MIFEQFFDPTSYTYTYLLVDKDSRQAIIIDPVKTQLTYYLQHLRAASYQLMIAMDTHIHADHITATGQLQDHTDCRIIMGHSDKTQHLCETIADGEYLQLGALKLQAIYTPGHTSDSYCYRLSDRLLTGDTLLIGGTGRTDFQHGDPGAAYDSLFHKILPLGDDLLIYPAHDYHGNQVSTIGAEKAHNPRLQVKNRQDYIELMNNLQLPQPKQMAIAVPANLQLGRI